MVNETYKKWMNVNPIDYDHAVCGDVVYAIDSVSKRGEIKHYGRGQIVKIEDILIPESVYNGFFSHLYVKRCYVMLDKGYIITNKDAFILNSVEAHTLLEDAHSTKEIDLEYIRIKEEYCGL